MIAIIGFSGTRYGMTSEQSRAFVELIETLAPVEFHHGDCVGADEQAHNVIRHTWPTSCRIRIHPINSSWQANCEGDSRAPVKDPLARNRDIVDESDVLIATPLTDDEQIRGGTWSTIRYARRIGKGVYIVSPTGLVTRERV